MEALVMLGLHGNMPMLLGYIGLESAVDGNEALHFLEPAERRLRTLIKLVQHLLQWSAIFRRPALGGLSRAIQNHVATLVERRGSVWDHFGDTDTNGTAEIKLSPIKSKLKTHAQVVTPLPFKSYSADVRQLTGATGSTLRLSYGLIFQRPIGPDALVWVGNVTIAQPNLPLVKLVAM